MLDLLVACVEMTGSDAELVWVDEAALAAGLTCRPGLPLEIERALLSGG